MKGALLLLLCHFGAVLGAFTVVTRQIRVGVYYDTCKTGENVATFLTQLNDKTFYNFTARWIYESDIIAGLPNTDVVFLAHSGSELDRNVLTRAGADGLRQFVNAGGGLVTGSFLSSEIVSTDVRSSFQSVSPVVIDGSYGFCPANSYPSIVVTSPSHPVFASLPNYLAFSVFASWSMGGLYSSMTNIQSIGSITGSGGCTGLTTLTSQQGVVVGNLGGGRVVYLSLTYAGLFLYNSQNLRFGYGDQLLENALYWASAVPPWCPTPCLNGGVCSAPNTCSCTGTGYTGSQCQTPSCAQTCLNGGSCVAPNNCSCPAGYSGNACQTIICNPSCQNGGNCTAPSFCTCPQGYGGPRCQSVNCSGITCDNGGTCSSPTTCDCRGTGFNGTTCQNPICTTPCQFGGVCIGNNRCDCTNTNHTGQFCQLPACNPPCQHGGQCTAVNFCTCTGTGYSGTLCDTPVCSRGCINGGNCVSPEYCSCPLGFEGESCASPTCFPPCIHNGTCTAPFTCNCTDTGYIGSFCQALQPPNITYEFTTGVRPTTGARRTSEPVTNYYTTGTGTTGDPVFAIGGAEGITTSTIGLIVGGVALCCIAIGCGMVFAKISGDRAIKKMQARNAMLIPVPVSAAEYPPPSQP